jgi:hypothetical protein
MEAYLPCNGLLSCPRMQAYARKAKQHRKSLLDVKRQGKTGHALECMAIQPVVGNFKAESCTIVVIPAVASVWQ